MATTTTTTLCPYANEYNLRDRGYGAAEIDLRLICLAVSGITYHIIDIRGNAKRTSVSDSAVTSLIISDNAVWEDEVEVTVTTTTTRTPATTTTTTRGPVVTTTTTTSSAAITTTTTTSIIEYNICVYFSSRSSVLETIQTTSKVIMPGADEIVLIQYISEVSIIRTFESETSKQQCYG